MINMTLAKTRGIPREDIARIEILQGYRAHLQKLMKELAEDDILQKDLFERWKKNEFDLQSLWCFEINSSYHKDYLLHHCKCPTMDNHIFLGTGRRIINKNCIYHGDGYASKNITVE